MIIQKKQHQTKLESCRKFVLIPKCFHFMQRLTFDSLVLEPPVKKKQEISFFELFY